MIKTKHFIEQSQQRFPTKDEIYLEKTFEYIQKLVRQWRLTEHYWNTPHTKEVKYKWMTYIYNSKDNILITIY